MKHYLTLLILIIVLSSNSAFAEITKTTGFIPGQIWYSESTLVEGDTIKIYTAVWNGDSNALNAKVDFYDGNVVLGGRNVVVEPSHLKEVFISWKVTSGDHSISARITSSTMTSDGKNEKVVLDRDVTSANSVFVPVAVKDADGNPASSADAIKSQVIKVKDDIKSIIPESISSPIENSFNSIDAMRTRVDKEMDIAKSDTREEINSYNTKVSDVNTESKVTPKPLDSTEKPIAYIKLFLISIVGFIFGSKIVFYGLALLIAFIFIRWLYRKIRNR